MNASILACLALCAAVGTSVSFAADIPLPKQENRNVVEKTLEKASPANITPGKDKSAGAPIQLPDVAQCKQEAQGLEGPSRSRVMTECLKRN